MQKAESLKVTALVRWRAEPWMTCGLLTWRAFARIFSPRRESPRFVCSGIWPDRPFLNELVADVHDQL